MIAAALLLLAGLGPCAQLSACTAKLRGPTELLPSARAALNEVGLPEGEPKAPPVKLAPAVLKGDVSFSFEVEPDGEQLKVRALSLHRSPSVFGLARVTPQPMPKPELQARARAVALRRGILLAMEDLSAQLLELAGQGQRRLKLSVRVNGLDSSSRQHVRETFLPCLKQQFDALGPVTEPKELAGYLEDEIEYAPGKDEPRDSLQWQADRLRATTLGFDAKCAPPPKTAVSFKTDPVGHGIVVELR